MFINTGRATWKRSSRCTGGQCVEVLAVGTSMLVRDSKQNDLGSEQPILSVLNTQWSTFVAEICGAAETGANGTLEIEHVPYGGVVLTAVDSDTRLTYTSAEWTAFVAGVKAGEFGETPAMAFQR